MLTDLLVKSKRWLIAGLAGLVLCGCSQDSPVKTPPQGEVNVTLDLNSDAKELRLPLSYMTITAPRVAGERVGHQGLVVVHGLLSISDGDNVRKDFTAYDLVCPNDWPTQVRLEVKKSKMSSVIIASCPKCNTQYDISMGTGMILNNDTQVAMVTYKVIRNGDQLFISNR